MLEPPMIPLELFTLREYIHANNLLVPFLLLLVGLYLGMVQVQKYISTLTEEKFKRYMKRFIKLQLLFITLLLIYYKFYGVLLIGILLSAFYIIVLNNKRYKALKHRLKELLNELY
ncbi:hypothetical protein JHD46_05275 [Sulfurimonas sp. SAG-AH-194-C20]|nr:hypothetical protein [Sulfurimonas sp. SAG-AH-194-C20]MDF1879050.1 hypothetical protein [Sulfurimonas sp. SAG-AH-194-C20]